MSKYTDVYIKGMSKPISLECTCDDVHKLIGEAVVKKQRMIQLTKTQMFKVEDIEAVIPMGVIYTGR